MIKKIILHFWSLREKFVKYFITGVSAVVLDIFTLYLLKEYAHFRPVNAVIVNQLFLLNYVFFINKYWSFKAAGMTHKQVVRFLSVCGLNYAISVGWMWIFNERFGVNYLLVRITNVALAVAWNFLLYNHWVYKNSEVANAVAEKSS